MKIATNKLSDLYEFYKNELSSIYDEGELYSVFELVCEKYLDYSKQQVKQHFQENINQSNLINIYNAGVELKKGTPIQYILKEAYFYDLSFNVSNAVLIPRPETESVIAAIKRLSKTYPMLERKLLFNQTSILMNYLLITIITYYLVTTNQEKLAY